MKDKSPIAVIRYHSVGIPDYKWHLYHLTMPYRVFDNQLRWLSFFNFNKILFLVKPMKQKTIKNWRQKQRSIGKQKRLRKEFKLLLTKKQASQQTVFNLPNRKKRSDAQSVNLESTNPRKEILDLNFYDI